MMTSTLPIHAAPVSFAGQIAMNSDGWQTDDYEPIKDGHPWCLKCHFTGVPSKLSGPANSRGYRCSAVVCREEYRVGCVMAALQKRGEIVGKEAIVNLKI